MSSEVMPHISSSPSPQVGSLLSELKNEIIERFESRSRAEIPAAFGKDSITIQNELSKFLEHLCQAFKQENIPDRAIDACKVAVAHGQQRVGVSGYSLTQVIREYSLLRQVIVEVLRKERQLSDDERTVIDWFIDEAIVASANVFAEGEQAKIKLALAQSERSNRDLDQFALIAAHDLKSPLNTIAGFSALIEEECRDTGRASIRESLEFIQKAIKRMTTLIDGLLEYARLRPLEHELPLVACNDAVQAAVQNLKSDLTAKRGRVFHEALPHINGDLVLLTQLFQNLISNALKFHGDEPPYIRIDSTDQLNFWEFTVEDNGIGFDPKDKEAIFGLYKKLHSTKIYDGAGIGLAACRRVVELHGGRIWAESEPRKGTSIFFTLPKVPRTLIHEH